MPEGDATEQSELQSRLGLVRHSLNTSAQQSQLPKRAVEVTGVCGAALVLIGMVFMSGVFGVVVAACGGLVLVAAYLISAKKHQRKLSTKIDVCEKGIVCNQGKTTRELLWNEVVEISSKKIRLPDGSESTALVFETAVPPPMLIMIGGTYCDKASAEKLLQALQQAWIAVWRRRAKALAQRDDLRVGKAIVRCGGVVLGGQEIGWSLITGVDVVDGVDRLHTKEGSELAEADGQVSLFPSAARRIAELAADPPVPLMLPPVGGRGGC